ncbi:MAG: type I-C CRISPR-associated protein Cas5c [Deinococcaceae bacterium]
MAQIIRCQFQGELALFSRPEFKVERVSYPIITPSAARGALEAIFWKPEFRYRIQRIGVVQLGSHTVILRNELENRQKEALILIEDQRQQRSSLMLKNVSYIVEATLHLRPHATDPIQKYLDCFQRRLQRGQYHHTPCLGTRECVADFSEVEMGTHVDKDLNLNLGVMLFDIAFVPSNTRKDLDFLHCTRSGEKKRTSGYAQALYFSAILKSGWLEVPQSKYDELEELEGRYVS